MVLLPLPAVVALLSDLQLANEMPQGGLLSLDVLTTVMLLGTFCLPAGELWPDLIIAATNTMYVLVRGLLTTRGLSFQISQVLAVFGMAAAGIHSFAVTGFLIVSTVAKGFQDDQDNRTCDANQLLVAFYVLVISVMVERRTAQLVSDSNANFSSYKALNLLSNHRGETIRDAAGNSQLVYYTDPAASQFSTKPLGQADSGPLPAGVQGDLEDGQHLPSATAVSSRSSLADYVLSKMAPEKSGRTTSLGGYVFSRLLEPQPEEIEESPGEGPRFLGMQVGVPDAAKHEAPSFAIPSRGLVRGEPAEVRLEDAPLRVLAEDADQRFATLPMPKLPPGSVQRQEEQYSSGATAAGQPAETGFADGRSRANTEAPPDTQPLPAPMEAVDSMALNVSAFSLQQEPSPPSEDRSPDSAAQLKQQRSPESMMQRLAVSKVARGVKLSGFLNPALNELFVECAEPDFQIAGRETYWTYANEYFLYRSEASNTWGAAKARRFGQIRKGNSNGLAHSPEGFDIWQPTSALAKKAWREWDQETRKWTPRPGSGIESRGKVRKKDNGDGPQEKGVQTDLQGEVQAVQPPPSAAASKSDF